MQAKVCTKCGEEKALSDFYKHKGNKDGLSYSCKKCSAKQKKIARVENKEHISKRRKEWRRKNEEKIKKYSAKWKNSNSSYFNEYYEKNKEHICLKRKSRYYENISEEKKRSKDYRKRNQVKERERRRRYSIENREKVMARQNRYRARKAGNGGSFTAKEWEDLKEKYGYKCLCCGEKKKLTADHVIPVSKGGTSNIDNIQPLCGSCNSSKGAWHSTDYRVTFSAESKL